MSLTDVEIVSLFKGIKESFQYPSDESLALSLNQRAEELDLKPKDEYSSLLRELKMEKSLEELEKQKFWLDNKYPSISYSKFEAFNLTMMHKSFKFVSSDRCEYSCIRLISIENYEKIPPLKVLKSIQKAKKDFSAFLIAYPEKVELDSISRLIDPIVFGVNPRLADTLFFIDEWDNDISFKELVG